jgi:hypothetical protein
LKLRFKILLVLIFLLVLGVFLLLPHGGYRREVEAYKQQLIAHGEKLTIAELAPPPYTGASNGATAFLQLMANYSAPTDDPPMMKMVVPGLAAIGSTNTNSVMTNRYAQNLQTMSQLRGLLSNSVLEFNPNYSMGYDTPLHHLASLKQAELLSADTTMQAIYVKNFPETRADLLAAVDLLGFDANEAVLISDLVRVAMAQVTMAATWEALQSCTWTDSQLAQLQAGWMKIDLFRNVEPSLQMETAWGIAELAEWRLTNYDDLPMEFSAWSTGSSSSSDDSGSLKEKLGELYNRYPRFWRWKTKWSYDEELCFLQMMEAAVKSARLANKTGAFAEALTKFNLGETNLIRLHPEATNEFLFWGPDGGIYSRYLEKQARCETARRICVTAIALKRYQLQHGAYPEKLDELVPDLLPSAPIDFMDGKPLRYQLRPDGDFRLYSVGVDGIDDGGDPRPPPSSTSLTWYLGRDIVWPRVATPATLEEYHQRFGSVRNAPGN